MTTAKNSFEQKLATLKAEYRLQLPKKIADISEDWNKLIEQWSTETFTILYRNVHSLIGTSGTFGFTELSKAARDLEIAIKPLLETMVETLTDDKELVSVINSNIYQLGILLETIQRDHTHSSDANDTAKLRAQLSIYNDTEITTNNILIYYLDDELTLPNLLVDQLANYGFKVVHFLTMQDFLSALKKEKPSLVLLDLILPDVNEAYLFMQAKIMSNAGVKVIFLSGKDDIQSRLAGVRAGAQAYLSKTTDVPTLVELIRRTLRLRITKPARVLIVDDQDSVAQFYSNILIEAGINTTVTTNPFNVLTLMQDCLPDLLLLDFNMPDISGDELGAVIRQHEQYQSIPMLFLSAEVNAERKTSLLEIGSDDLLLKGMPPEELVRQVKSRITRAKILSTMMYQDSLTGLLNHAQIQLAAERVFSGGKRQKTVSCIAMIDIDNFKKINDSYGHLTGDRVIKALANLLEQRLRLTDYIGRFGGEEFMLVLPDINVNEAASLLNNLRKSFAAIEFNEANSKFTVTFSAGVAESTGMNNFMKQIKCADEAMYRAKTRGRNLVCANLKGDVQ
ncbi:MAG: diguanylate cyclase [Pseudomonadota bacterium]